MVLAPNHFLTEMSNRIIS